MHIDDFNQPIEPEILNVEEGHTIGAETDTSFIFDMAILDDSIESIHTHTISSYMQISLIVLLDMAYLFAYGGLRGTAFYLFDLCPSGKGKDSSANHSFELFLKPIMEIQNERKKQYEYERQISEDDLPPRSFHCIHISDATPQGTYRAFETTKAQYPRLGEVGNKMKNKEHPLMNFITDGYGKHTLIQPNYKKDLDIGGDLCVDNISLFFYGNSNIQMMSGNTLLHHLQGGLLNRCILVYNTYTRPFEQRPHIYTLPRDFVTKIHHMVQTILEFAQNYADRPVPPIPRTAEYVTFDRYIYDQTELLGDTEIRDLFRRTMQNLNAIILTLHYIRCWERQVWFEEVEESTVHTGVKFMRYVLGDYSKLTDEIIGAAKDERDESNIEKLHQKIQELSPNKDKIRHRELYRALHLNRKEYDGLLRFANYKTDKHFLYLHPVTG